MTLNDSARIWILKGVNYLLFYSPHLVILQPQTSIYVITNSSFLGLKLYQSLFRLSFDCEDSWVAPGGSLLESLGYNRWWFIHLKIFQSSFFLVEAWFFGWLLALILDDGYLLLLYVFSQLWCVTIAPSFYSYNLEDLISISKTQKVLEPQIQEALRRRLCECRAGPKRRDRKGKFKPSLPSIIA